MSVGIRCARETVDEHREVEKELRGLRHLRLEVDRGLVRIDAHSEIAQHVLSDVCLDVAKAVEPRGQHVEIRDQDEGLVGFLERHAVLQGADQVPEVKRARRPIARQCARATIS